MSAYEKAFPIFAILAAATLFSGRAAADNDAIVCDNPTVARDLIGVVDRPAVFSEWLHGYLESGHCVPVNTGRLGLIAPDGKKRTVVRYAIVLPKSRLHETD